MIPPESHHKRTAAAMRQDSAEITPEQIEDARKLMAKYPNLTQITFARRPQAQQPVRLPTWLWVICALIILAAVAAPLRLWLTS